MTEHTLCFNTLESSSSLLSYTYSNTRDSQHTEQPEIINEGRVDQYPEQCQVKSPMLDSSPDNQTTEYSKQSLESKTTEQTTSLLANNAELKAQIQEKVVTTEPTTKVTIFRTVGLRWVPTGKIFTPSTTKVDSEPPNGSNADITNQYESTQTLDVSAGTSNLSAGTSFNPKKEELRVWLLKRLISEKPGLHGIFI
ncbi:hypothetical protein Tco_1286016 [Tanacetum coccineum]